MLENSETISRFEQAASTKDVAQREAQLAQLTQQLPDCNRVLLAWVTLHLDHVTARVGSRLHRNPETMHAIRLNFMLLSYRK